VASGSRPSLWVSCSSTPRLDAGKVISEGVASGACDAGAGCRERRKAREDRSRCYAWSPPLPPRRDSMAWRADATGCKEAANLLQWRTKGGRPNGIGSSLPAQNRMRQGSRSRRHEPPRFFCEFVSLHTSCAREFNHHPMTSVSETVLSKGFGRRWVAKKLNASGCKATAPREGGEVRRRPPCMSPRRTQPTMLARAWEPVG
jgi:hypothetical protein